MTCCFGRRVADDLDDALLENPSPTRHEELASEVRRLKLAQASMQNEIQDHMLEKARLQLGRDEAVANATRLQDELHEVRVQNQRLVSRLDDAEREIEEHEDTEAAIVQAATADVVENNERTKREERSKNYRRKTGLTIPRRVRLMNTESCQREVQQLQSAQQNLMELSKENAFLMASKKALDEQYKCMFEQGEQQKQDSTPEPEEDLRTKTPQSCKSVGSVQQVEDEGHGVVLNRTASLFDEILQVRSQEEDPEYISD